MAHGMEDDKNEDEDVMVDGSMDARCSMPLFGIFANHL
jgi:hypothetical protein